MKRFEITKKEYDALLPVWGIAAIGRRKKFPTVVEYVDRKVLKYYIIGTYEDYIDSRVMTEFSRK